MNTLNTNVKTRRNYWLLIEKIIGCILLLWSMFALYSILSVVTDMFRYGYIAAGNASIGSLIKTNHLIVIISLLCLFGSWMLLFRHKAGWIFCVISSLVYCVNLFMSSRSKTTEHYKSYSIASILFFIIFILLLSKPIRIKYQPTVKTWVLISVTIVLCILDKIIF